MSVYRRLTPPMARTVHIRGTSKTTWKISAVV
jgi:hypothetical protein